MPYTVDHYKRLFTDATEASVDWRTRALKDIDYYDGKQWTDDERRALKLRHQPDIVINRVKPAVNGVLGVVERGKADPKALPRTPKDDGSADVATDVLRYVCDFNRWHKLKVECFRDVLIPGTCAVVVEGDEDKQVIIRQIRWEEFFADPRSRAADFSDARYLGIAKWMYADDVGAMYPESRAQIDATIDTSIGTPGDVSFDDRPSGGVVSWVDGKLRRVLVVEVYCREGRSWRHCVFWAGGKLHEGESQHLDDRGKPTCPIVAVSAYVTRENERYGMVRDMLGPQDEINHRRSRSVHIANTRQIQENPQSEFFGTVDAATAAAEAAKPNGVIPPGWQIVPTSDLFAGQVELLREAKSEIERMGPNPAILGREGNDASGRALMARQQSGMIELAILFGRLEDFELRVMRQVWGCVRQSWDAPQYIRVTDDEGAPRFVVVNEPEVGVKTAPVTDPATGQLEINPLTGQPVMQEQQVTLGYKNRVAEMDVDIIIDSVPDTANLQQEQFETLVQLAGGNPAYAQQVPFEMMLQLSAIPHKKEIIDQIKSGREQMQQQQMQQAQQMQQIAQAGAMADIEETKSKAAKNVADAEKTAIETRNLAIQPQINALTAGVTASAGL